MTIDYFRRRLVLCGRCSTGSNQLRIPSHLLNVQADGLFIGFFADLPGAYAMGVEVWLKFRGSLVELVRS